MDSPASDPLTGCELHVHIGGCFYVEDLLDIGRDIYADVDWTLYHTNFERAFGGQVDAAGLFRDALSGDADAVARLKQHYVLGPDDGGDFHKFVAKFSLLACLYRHMARLDRESELVRRVTARHRAEGFDYVEYRAMYPHGSEDASGFVAFHRLNAIALRQACDDSFTARYIISLPRWEPIECYHLVEQLLLDSPELADTVVGLDFCHVEEGHPPKTARPLFDLVHKHNTLHPERALEIVYHVGESYFDKTLESAIRWCHEAALLGARRLGHVIALGLDPALAVGRRARAHECELVSERLDQIDYDLSHAGGLRDAGVDVDADALTDERRALQQRRHDEDGGGGSYSAARLEEVRRRQEYVLGELSRLRTIVESCPTSNALIGAVEEAAAHPVRRLLESEVPLVIGADDPGIFDSPLATEIDWVRTHGGLSRDALQERLGDPRRFRLGALRP